MAALLANLAYLLALFLYMGAVLLILEWMVHLFPGAALNPLRRMLFQASFPLLKWGDSFLSLRWGSFQSRGLLTATLFLVLCRYGVPWLVLASYSLRG